MENLEVTISIGFFQQLLEAQKEADMFKRLLKEREWTGIKSEELRVLCKALGLSEKE